MIFRSIYLSFCLFRLIYPSNAFQVYKRTPSSIRQIRVQHAFTVNMHMGHSHDHQHLHEDNHGTAKSLQFDQKFLRRSGIRILFSAALFLLPPLLRRQMSKTDVTIFVGTIVALNVYDSLRNSIKGWLGRLKILQKSLLKHTTPLSRAYFFKNENAADRVTLISVWTNILLSAVKFVGGIAFNSAVLVADAGHSLSDLLSDFITLYAVQIARLPADDDHPYGHGKFEAVGSLFLSMTLVMTGMSIGLWSYDKMHSILVAQYFSSVPAAVVGAMSSATLPVAIPSWPALVLAAISIASKEWLFRITKRVGDALNSQVVIANAWHHRSDAFSSILSLASIAIAILFPKLLFVDSAAGILVAGMICLTGFEVMIESIKQLTDTLDAELSQKISTVALDVRGVLGVQSVRARSMGSDSLVDMTVLTDHQIPAAAAQNIGEDVRWKILQTFPYVSDVMVRTSAVETYCPLLSKQLKVKRSLNDVETDIRMILNQHSDVKDVTRIKVHHMNSALLSVEGVIRVDPSITVSHAQTVAKLLQNEIKIKTGIEFAAIQLDLSE